VQSLTLHNGAYWNYTLAALWSLIDHLVNGMRQSNINIASDKRTDEGKPAHNSSANKAIVELFDQDRI